MKKAKRQDKTLLMLCIGVVFMLIVTAVMSFAYFTARAQSETQTIQFGVLELDPVNDFNLTSKEGHMPIVPGCTINMAGTIKLTDKSNVDAFVRLKPTVTVTKDGVKGTDGQKAKFVALFNDALSAGTESSWLKRNDGTTDDYLYFVGKFSNGETNARIVEKFDFTGSSFTIDPTTFGNEWQGVTVSIGLTVQAIQASHVDVDDVNSDKYPATADGDQALVNAIANAEAWNSEELQGTKPATMKKLIFTINSTDNTASVKGEIYSIKGDVVIPAYIKEKTGGGYDEATSGETGAIPVTWITNNAFNGRGITSITIPEGVISIKQETFFGCSSLKSITIPNSVTSIGKSAFRNCTSLVSITIPSSVTSIEAYAFKGCSGLTSITIPNSVTSIVSFAFDECSNLATVIIDSEDIAKKLTKVNVYGNLILYAKTIKIKEGINSVGSYVTGNNFTRSSTVENGYWVYTKNK